ncbi:MAG TPA: ABC transporter ATP-binding protein [Rhodospirillaceae bacterium]|nr:ABC transporter ATP-binding protein [Rhodospirillaceae bacterium]
MTTPPAIEVQDLSLVYGQGQTAVRAVDAVSMAVRRGEMLALMGPSGSGKTTLLMVMGCLLRPSAGRVALLGRDLAQLSPAAMAAQRLAHVGFVFQSYNLFPALTARETLRMTLRLKGWEAPAAEAEAVRLLDLVGLGDRLDSVPAKLSGGQKQRVAIARAVAGGPEVVLGDEPTAALDWKTGSGIVAMLRDLARQGDRAVVLVTHDPRVADLADRVIHMADGRLVEATP